MDMRSPVEATADLPEPDFKPSASGRGAGYAMLLTTALLWGVNWPVGKRLLQELPPLSMRGIAGLAGGLLLFGVAALSGQSLRVPRDQWLRLLLYAVLSVSGWMGLIGLALVHLPASETSVLGASIPIWAAGLAWPVLGERLTLKRVFAMLLAFAGIVILMGGHGVAAAQAKLPGIMLVLVASFMFALSAVLAKLKPLRLPPLASAAWQISLGCFIVMIGGLLFETPHLLQLSTLGWSLFAFTAVGQVCAGFACWFGALSRLPASTASMGTMLVPVIGVIASAVALGEPLGPTQIGALMLTVTGVAIATRA
ncbi:MAG: DMT family transporter [Xanthobacteraceae bacterium]|nr:DMT family transporter [Xanthobacteraceae bacterium]